MKTINGDWNRIHRCKEVHSCGEFSYSFDHFYGTFPPHLADIPAVSGYCDKEDNLYIITRDREHPIIVLDKDGNYIRDFGKGLFVHLHDIRITEQNTILLVDSARHAVWEMDFEGGIVRVLGNIDIPSDSGYDPTMWKKMRRMGKTIPSDCIHNSDWEFDMARRSITHAAPPFNKPTGVDIDSKGNLWFSDGYGNAAVHKFSLERTYVSTFGQPGDGPGKFTVPHDICIDLEDRIWIADREGNCIHIFNPDGTLVAYVSEGLYQPTCMRFDGTYMYIGERTGGLTIMNQDLQIVAQLGAPHSAFRFHGMSLNSKGDIYLMPLHSYEEHQLLKLTRV